MRKMKKINGYLIVRFNDREKREYPELGVYGVIDAELYSGNLTVDLSAMEYTDADRIEIAVEQARGLDSEFDVEEPEVKVTIVKETDSKTSEDSYDPVKMFDIARTLLELGVQKSMGKDIDPRTAAHELRGFAKALMTMGVVSSDDERFYVPLDSFKSIRPRPAPGPEARLAYICDELCKHRAAGMSQEELDAICDKCEAGRWCGDPPTPAGSGKPMKLIYDPPKKLKELHQLLNLLKEVEDYVNQEDEGSTAAGSCCSYQDDGYKSVGTLTGGQIAELSPHDYEEVEIIEGCTVQTLRCRKCGAESFAWFKPGTNLEPLNSTSTTTERRNER